MVAADVRRDAARRLYRLRRGGARHGPPPPVAEDQSTHPRHCRQARSSDAGRGERVHQEPHPGRTARAARRRAYFQCRAGGGLHQCGARILASQLKVTGERRTDDRGCTRCTQPKTRSQAMSDEERYRRGANARRKILGDAWVDRADANRNSFNAEWQYFITRCAWGEIWTRPHFDERTRRVLVIGTMMAIGRWEEFRMHLRAALVEGGFSPDDIKEIILQQAIYCGVPVGNHAFRQAGEVLEELGKSA